MSRYLRAFILLVALAIFSIPVAAQEPGSTREDGQKRQIAANDERCPGRICLRFFGT